MLDFWAMTPRETVLMIDAAVRREELEQRRILISAYLTASLTRAKRIPRLQALLAASTPAKPLRGAELVRRQEEFEEMSRAENLDQVIKRANDGSNPTRRSPDPDPGDA